MDDMNKGKSKRGFASMDQDEQRRIASEGGKAAHERGTAHEFDSREAQEAGRKGGQSRGSGNRSKDQKQGQGMSDTDSMLNDM